MEEVQERKSLPARYATSAWLQSGNSDFCCLFWLSNRQTTQSQKPGPDLRQVKFWLRLSLAAVLRPQLRSWCRRDAVQPTTEAFVGWKLIDVSEMERLWTGRFLCQRLQNHDTAVGMGCSRGKVGCLLISSESLGLETAENNLKLLCQAALPSSFLKMEPFTLTDYFFSQTRRFYTRRVSDLLRKRLMPLWQFDIPQSWDVFPPSFISPF